MRRHSAAAFPWVNGRENKVSDEVFVFSSPTSFFVDVCVLVIVLVCNACFCFLPWVLFSTHTFLKQRELLASRMDGWNSNAEIKKKKKNVWLGFPSVCLFVFEAVKSKWKISGTLSNKHSRYEEPSVWFLYFLFLSSPALRVAVVKAGLRPRPVASLSQGHMYKQPITFTLMEHTQTQGEDAHSKARDFATCMLWGDSAGWFAFP